ncbi:MAG TPA: hypothetical protein VG295_07050 [Solirubrobacteraceae bacterium]|nr:hypothetical protein [Solirubrobacteraceae bacterium]
MVTGIATIVHIAGAVWAALTLRTTDRFVPPKRRAAPRPPWHPPSP